MNFQVLAMAKTDTKVKKPGLNKYSPLFGRL